MPGRPTTPATSDFYPRPPRGGRRPNFCILLIRSVFLSTPSARRATPIPKYFDKKYEEISIHALREEGDQLQAGSSKASRNFYPRPPRGGRRVFFFKNSLHLGISIHALREEGDAYNAVQAAKPGKFLSTPSARRATAAVGVLTLDGQFLSTPSARRATGGRALHGITHDISIHALREEGDHHPRHYRQRGPISIHALREEGDAHRWRRYSWQWRISIHALREEGDPGPCPCEYARIRFLSTPSARRATCTSARRFRSEGISIHALREEGDKELYLTGTSTDISIHALREEGDKLRSATLSSRSVFLSTPSARRATLVHARHHRLV